MLKLNIGFCKKIGEANYGSRGASANLEVEVETSLIDNPAELHERIRRLYRLARQSVDEELATGCEHSQQNGRDNDHSNENGRGSESNGNSNSRQPNGRAATQSQVRAIHAIANRQRIDLPRELSTRFGVQRPDELDIRQASEFIDAIKPQSQENGNGERR